jgi:hypothetical protein
MVSFIARSIFIIGGASTFTGDHTGTYRIFWSANLSKKLAFRRCGYTSKYVPTATPFRLFGWL